MANLINIIFFILDDVECNAPPPATRSYSDWASIDNYSYKQDDSDDEDDDNELFDAM